MNLYGIVINISGLEQQVKLVEEDVYNWVTFPDNKKATIDLVPFTVYEKIVENEKNLKYFRNDTNELVKPSNYEDFKAELAPSYKDGFDNLNDAKKFAKESGNKYIDTIIKYLRS